MNYFKELSISTSFPLCYNLLPHFAAAEQEYGALRKCVDAAMEDGRIGAFFLSDHPARRQNFSSLHLAKDILASGGEPIVSLSLACNDRNGALEKLQEYSQAGVRQFLFVSGDYPLETDKGRENPLSDLDSVQLLMLLTDFRKKNTIAAGCAVSPFKTFESEQVWQFEKLRRKISVGADFVISQLGYDMRKFDELIRFCALHKITAPLVANIFITDMQTAGLIQARRVPGVKIPGPLLRTLYGETSDCLGPQE
ncbi:MAG: hypothetical protein AMJ60_12245, partial [Desulfobacterales bacterium SG8_35]